MSTFKFTVTGSSKRTEAFCRSMLKIDKVILDTMKSCGQRGVDALASATPVESGLAHDSWDFATSVKGKTYRITWTNSDVENGFPVAIMLQYGYGTGTGGYVEGRDYINSAIQPIFDEIAATVWKAVTSA